MQDHSGQNMLPFRIAQDTVSTLTTTVKLLSAATSKRNSLSLGSFHVLLSPAALAEAGAAICLSFWKSCLLLREERDDSDEGS
jgi:hypothetical protein